MGRAYKNIPVPLTLDLVGAVIRQRGFTAKMVGGVVDWEERDALPNATIRYNQFLKLMKAEPTTFLVPTLDVDLMWHTHQCHPLQYQDYGLREMKRVINHDDSVEAEVLTKSFDQTAKNWKRYYGETYSAYVEESKWFRKPAVYPEYAVQAAAKAVTISRATRVALNNQGGCTVHDPTPMPVPTRRSLAKYPINASITTALVPINK
ncbi:hypothetical protein HDU99_006706, partial [Rhizoclosmatium hyalinum]